MKFLLLFLSLFTSLAWGSCEKHPGKDYASLYQRDEEDPILLFPEELTKGIVLYLVAAKDSCGATSCEYAGYIEEKKGCFQRKLSFTGSFKLGNPVSNGLRPVIVTVPFDENKKSCEWHYEPLTKKMNLVESTCKISK